MCYSHLLIVFLAYCRLSSSQLVESSFRSAGIVSDVLDRAPSDLLEVKYENSSDNLGNELTPTQVLSSPTVSWPVYNHTAIYTLIMIDPDVPSRVNRSVFGEEMKVWLVGNIEGNNIATGETIAEYLSPAPSNGTWHHRYVFLAYQQPNRIDYSLEPRSSNSSTENRFNFLTRNFTVKYNLGHPEAGNFFLAEYKRPQP